MKTTTMLLAGAALVAAGVLLSKRVSAEDKQNIKDMLKKKLTGSLPQSLQNKLSMSN